MTWRWAVTRWRAVTSWWQDDAAGSGSILAIGIVAALVTVLGLSVPTTMALAARHTVAAAADAAAIAAADTAVGIYAGVPCDRAAQVVEAHGVTLSSCAVDGLVVTVAASRGILGVTVTGKASAGPAR